MVIVEEATSIKRKSTLAVSSKELGGASVEISVE